MLNLINLKKKRLILVNNRIKEINKNILNYNHNPSSTKE
jgi:hypothetical protein